MHSQTDQTERPMRAGHDEKLASRTGSGGMARSGESPDASTISRDDRSMRNIPSWHTPEKKMSLNSLAVEIIEINIANGWNVLKPEQWEDTYKVPAILALIHSETSEALEAFRKGDKANFSEELADTLIRVLDCAGGLGIDIDSAVAAKLAKNKTRGFRHGGKRV